MTADLCLVDASVTVKWLVEEKYSGAADRLLEGKHELFAPRLMAAEVGNALWRKVRMGEIERSPGWRRTFTCWPRSGLRKGIGAASNHRRHSAIFHISLSQPLI